MLLQQKWSGGPAGTRGAERESTRSRTPQPSSNFSFIQGPAKAMVWCELMCRDGSRNPHRAASGLDPRAPYTAGPCPGPAPGLAPAPGACPRPRVPLPGPTPPSPATFPTHTHTSPDPRPGPIPGFSSGRFFPPAARARRGRGGERPHVPLPPPPPRAVSIATGP